MVYVNGAETSCWEFSLSQNRQVRTVTLDSSGEAKKKPGEAKKKPDGDIKDLRITFKPRSRVTPRDVNLPSNDSRELGMALRRFRVRRL
jgi:hypothetical protein